MKPRRAFTSATADVCTDCRRTVREAGGMRGITGADLTMTGLEPNVYAPMPDARRMPIVEAITLSAVTSEIAKLFKPMPRCECCWETRHVARDGYGGVVVVCKRCEYQIMHMGACHLHHGRVIYPELAPPPTEPPSPLVAVASPPEIEGLFYVPESDKSKYDAAELADADV